MKPAEFQGQNAVFGADQPEYQPLPAFKGPATEHAVTSFWECTPEEAELIKQNGGVWVTQLTFGRAFQPQLVEASRPANLPEII